MGYIRRVKLVAPGNGETEIVLASETAYTEVVAAANYDALLPPQSKVESGYAYGFSSELLGSYPTTAASKAAQLVDDQAAVLAKADKILAGNSILDQAGTLVPTITLSPDNFGNITVMAANGSSLVGVTVILMSDITTSLTGDVNLTGADADGIVLSPWGTYGHPTSVGLAGNPRAVITLPDQQPWFWRSAAAIYGPGSLDTAAKVDAFILSFAGGAGWPGGTLSLSSEHAPTLTPPANAMVAGTATTDPDLASGTWVYDNQAGRHNTSSPPNSGKIVLAVYKATVGGTDYYMWSVYDEAQPSPFRAYITPAAPSTYSTEPNPASDSYWTYNSQEGDFTPVGTYVDTWTVSNVYASRDNVKVALDFLAGSTSGNPAGLGWTIVLP